MTDLGQVQRVAGIRRIAEDDPIILRPFRRTKCFEILFVDGTRRLATMGDVDTALNGRRFPADFWVTVDAADVAFAESDDRFVRRSIGTRFTPDDEPATP